MQMVDRRGALKVVLHVGATPIVASLAVVHASEPAAADPAMFIREAFRLRDAAVAAGDQPYGAVVVMDGSIVGFGPSRVITDRNPDAHAERVALWATQAALGRKALDGAVIYSSSVPCAACQRALAEARVARMIHGRDAIDGGPPNGLVPR